MEVEDDPELLEDEDPAEAEDDAVPEVLDEAAVVNAVVVVPEGLVKEFEPPHPTIEKIARTSAAVPQQLFGF